MDPEYESRPTPRSYNPHPAESIPGWYVLEAPALEDILRAARMAADTIGDQAIHFHDSRHPCTRACQVIRVRRVVSTVQTAS